MCLTSASCSPGLVSMNPGPYSFELAWSAGDPKDRDGNPKP